MNTSLFARSRRWLLTLAVAAVLAVTASYAPVLLDGATGTSLTAAAFACSAPGGGC
jgi:hypothetical protein